MAFGDSYPGEPLGCSDVAGMSREVCGSCGAVLGAPEPAEGRPKGAAVRVGQAFAYVTVGALALVIVISLVAAAYALVTAVWA